MDKAGWTVKLPVLYVIVVLLLFTIALSLKIFSDPEVPFLFSENGAEWIRPEKPVHFGVRTEDEEIVFRKRFKLETVTPNAIITIRAMRNSAIYLDNQLLSPYSLTLRDWKEHRSVRLGNSLTPGEHEIRIAVFNRNGPALLLAFSKELNLFTGQGWEASINGVEWTPAASVEKITSSELSRQFPSAGKALLSLLPLYLSLFLVVFFSSLYLNLLPKQASRMRRMMLGPSGIRWLLLGAWALLMVTNIRKIPLYVGYDALLHYEYIFYVAEKWRIPLAPEGWQMFQSPLYYIISALLSLPLAHFFDKNTVALLLRVIPLCCGALQVELSFRAMRYVFPAREDLQSLGTVIGGLLPMNLYLSQTVSNEPLAGTLSSVVLVMCLGLMLSRRNSFPKGRSLYLGTALGLALLTKVTAVLLVPSLVFLLTCLVYDRKQEIKATVGRISSILCVVFIISGWYYLRNWIELGKPFVGGWEVSRNIAWWQDPGYRTVNDFTIFGKSIVHPMFSATNSFWDSLYSTFWLDGFNGNIFSQIIHPPWNYSFMLSGALLALLPASGIIVGLLISLFRSFNTEYRGQLLAVFCILIYLIALIYVYLMVPIYSTAKATYTVGLTPCYAILCVTGLDLLLRNPVLRAVITAWIFCWAVAAYFSYLVL